MPVVSKGRALALLVLFYLLACGMSVAAISLAARTPADSPAELLANPWLLIAKFGPSLAGLIVAAVIGRDRLAALLADVVVVRDPLALIGWGVAFPAAVTLAAAFIGAQVHAPPLATRPIDLTVMGHALEFIGLRTFLGGGLGEEIGFRGVALPLLLLLTGPRRAAVILGLAWGLWHAPALFGKGPLIWVAQIVLTTSISVFFAYVWVRVRNGLPIVILMHGALNGWTLIIEKLLFPALDNDLVWQAGRILILVALAVGLCFARWPTSRTGIGAAP